MVVLSRRISCPGGRCPNKLHAGSSERGKLSLINKERTSSPNVITISVLSAALLESSQCITCITGHLPTGEYRSRFHENTNTACIFDDGFHTQTHILCKCHRYRHVFHSMERLQRYKNTLPPLLKLLKLNETLATFKDVPDDQSITVDFSFFPFVLLLAACNACTRSVSMLLPCSVS